MAANEISTSEEMLIVILLAYLFVSHGGCGAGRCENVAAACAEDVDLIDGFMF